MFFKMLFEFFIAFMGATSFAVFFKAPKRSLLPCGIISGTGWIIYYSINRSNSSSIVAVFFATLIIGLLSEVFARIMKAPVTVFLIPCITPIVPGAGMYYTMLYIMQSNRKLISYYSYQTLMSAGSIAVAIIVSSSVFRLYKSYQIKSTNKK